MKVVRGRNATTPTKSKTASETMNSRISPPQSAFAFGRAIVVRWLIACVIVMTLLFGGNSTRAQQITGTIAGTVTDSEGAVVRNASVKATNTGTGFSQVANTDNIGAYSISYLPVGTYVVEITSSGFKRFALQNV